MKKLDWKKLFRMQAGSIGLILFGVLLLVKPDFGSAAMATILGWLLVGAGAAGLILGILSRHTLGYGIPIGALVFLGSGIYLLRSPLMLASLLGIWMGLLLLWQGIGAVKDAWDLKRCGGKPGISLILGIGLLALGAYLILSPLATSRFVMTAIGLILVALGISNLINHSRARRYISTSASADTIIDAQP